MGMIELIAKANQYKGKLKSTRNNLLIWLIGAEMIA
jgi:hypothetical protein